MKSIAGAAGFVVVGVVFISIGSSGQRAFLPIGIAFIVIGSMFIIRQRRSGRLK